MPSPLNMQPAFFSLILTAIHVSVLVDCRPRHHDPEQLPQHQQSNFYPETHADTSSGIGRFYSGLSGSMRRGIHRDFLVVLPVRTDTSNIVSIFDLRKKRFLCMDIKGEVYISRQKNKDDCLFQHIWVNVANHHHILYSPNGGLLLKLEGAELHQVSPEPSLALLKRFQGSLVKRQRRSEEVNPSDPLRTHSHPSHSAKDNKDTAQGQPEQDQAGAVSKETITSCDDPLRVLQPNGPVSPVKTNIADRAEQH